MAKKNNRNTKSRIIAAAWKLFYEQGYDDTTVEEIVEESGTSKGSFYHYFNGKDALLGSLSELFDDKYTELIPTLKEDMHSFDKLMYLNREMFRMIDNSISLDLLARLYSSQLITTAFTINSCGRLPLRGSRKGSCGTIFPSMSSSRPMPFVNVPSFTTGVCAAGNIPSADTPRK